MPPAQIIPFHFGPHQVRTLLIGDQPWFVAADVCASLSIGNVSLAVNGRADRESDGLDEDEKGIATVNTPSGEQGMLVVSESGLYALIFKSRKPEAKRFKKWVTAEVLPAIRKHGRYENNQNSMATLIDQTIGTDGFHMLGAVVKGKVSRLPAPIQRRATAKIWSQTHAAFGVRSAADIPADQLDAARNFIAAYAIEGEYLPKEEVVVGKINWPASRWQAEAAPPIQQRMVAFQGKGNIMLAPDMLYGGNTISPTLRAIAQLEQQGHNLEACRLEVLAMKYHLEGAENLFYGLRSWADKTQGCGVRFKVASAAE